MYFEPFFLASLLCLKVSWPRVRMEIFFDSVCTSAAFRIVFYVYSRIFLFFIAFMWKNLCSFAQVPPLQPSVLTPGISVIGAPQVVFFLMFLKHPCSPSPWNIFFSSLPISTRFLVTFQVHFITWIFLNPRLYELSLASCDAQFSIRARLFFLSMPPFLPDKAQISPMLKYCSYVYDGYSSSLFLLDRAQCKIVGRINYPTL